MSVTPTRKPHRKGTGHAETAKAHASPPPKASEHPAVAELAKAKVEISTLERKFETLAQSNQKLNEQLVVAYRERDKALTEVDDLKNVARRLAAAVPPAPQPFASTDAEIAAIKTRLIDIAQEAETLTGRLADISPNRGVGTVAHDFKQRMLLI